MIRIVGDVCFSDGYFDMGFGIGSALKYNYNPFENIQFDSADIWIGNLECVISDISEQPGFKARYFRVPFNDLTGIKHLDIYGVANNHVMQHGAEAFRSMTHNISELGSQYVGSADKKTLIVEHKLHKFGFAAFSQKGESFSKNPLYWICPEYDEILIESRNLQNCDFRIAYLHWGEEFIDYPNVEQKKFAHWLIDCGFDLVIGVHSHVLQGFEIYKDKYIFYSLGNFLFNMPTEETRHSAIVNIDVENNLLLVNYNYVFNNKSNKPAVIDKSLVPEKYLFETLNKKIRINKDSNLYYEDLFRKLRKFRLRNRKWMLTTMHKHNLKELIYVLSNFISRRLRKRANELL